MRRLKYIILLAVLLSLLISSTAFAAPAQGGGYWYTVRWGDTLFAIGRATGANPWDIAAANGLGAPYTIFPGQQLWIPAWNPAPPPPPPYPQPMPGPHCGYWRPVYVGDTLFSIAHAVWVNPWAIAAANGIYNVNLIFAGRSLWIPCHQLNVPC